MTPSFAPKSPAGVRDATIQKISNGPSFAKKVPDDSSTLTTRPTERQQHIAGTGQRRQSQCSSEFLHLRKVKGLDLINLEPLFD
jgi:hypothetical protein